MFDQDLRERASELVALYRARGQMLAVAESCTGGLVAGLITEIPGSSRILDRSYVTYSNQAKSDCLNVAATLLDTFGAVSAEVARAMAEGTLDRSAAPIALAVTGIAGPEGGTVQKPIGLVHFACGRRGAITMLEKRYGDIGRSAIRIAAVATALSLLFDAAGWHSGA